MTQDKGRRGVRPPAASEPSVLTAGPTDVQPSMLPDERVFLPQTIVMSAAVRGNGNAALEAREDEQESTGAHDNADGKTLNLLVHSETASSSAAAEPTRGSIDALIIAPNAGLMIVGWIADIARPLRYISIIASDWRVIIDESRFMRLRRMDVEAAINSHGRHEFGFFGFLHFDRGAAGHAIKVELVQEGGASTSVHCEATQMDDLELRNTALAHLAGAVFFGNPGIEAMRCLAQGIGSQFVRFNRSITRRVVAAPYFERFGPRLKTPHGTIVVCLFGKPEFYFLQNCLFSGLPGIRDYEFIYVSNSPEMAETLLREAKSASLLYGLTNTVMILAGNAGFGAANNAAARISGSHRLLIVNPDVFPYAADWALKHTALLNAGVSERTRLFGLPLYYDDGSLMHAGMYFDVDTGLTLNRGAPVAQRAYRVEHYGKGTPPADSRFTVARAVPAVTGAFMSVEKAWFETLGGFTEDFIFGHYEDADLCLKSIDRGVAPWLHDIRMWHLEGKGSTRQLPHVGGSIVNRWLFSQRWMNMLENGLLGDAPSHALLRPHPTRSSIAEDPRQRLQAPRKPGKSG